MTTIKLGSGANISFGTGSSAISSLANFYSDPYERDYFLYGRWGGKSYMEAMRDMEIERQKLSTIVTCNVKLENPIDRIKVSGTFKLEDRKMKLTFYYTNNKTYTATGVTNYRQSGDNLLYSIKKNKGLYSYSSDYSVSLSDVKAYVVKDKDETKVVKVKPNAVVKMDIK